MDWIKNIFTIRIEFNLFLVKGNYLTNLEDEKRNKLPIFKSNKVFIKEFLKISTKRGSYKIVVSNKRFNNFMYSVKLVEKDFDLTSYYTYLNGNYKLEFCANHFRYYFKNKIPKTIYFSVQRF